MLQCPIIVPLQANTADRQGQATAAVADHQTAATSAVAAATELRWKAALTQTANQAAGVWGRSPDLGVGWKCVSDASAVTEVHLRRLDAADELHRRVVAVLTVDATPEEVYGQNSIRVGKQPELHHPRMCSKPGQKQISPLRSRPHLSFWKLLSVSCVK